MSFHESEDEDFRESNVQILSLSEFELAIKFKVVLLKETDTGRMVSNGRSIIQETNKFMEFSIILCFGISNLQKIQKS